MLRSFAVVASALLVATLASSGAVHADASPAADDRATRDDYVLDTTGTTAKLKLDGDGVFSVVITPKNGKKVHPDAPVEITLKDNALVHAAKQKLGRNDVVDKASKAPELRTGLHGVKAGSATLEANVSFFLCTDAWCQRMSDRVQVPISVE